MMQDDQIIDEPPKSVETTEASTARDQFEPSASNPIGDERIAGQTRLRAMIVDTNLIARDTAAAMFRKMGYHVTTANEGGDAVFQLQKLACNLLLTSLEMPVINGYQLARRIKMFDPSTKAVIMTDLNLIEVAPLLKDGGIDGWLFKPFGFKELKAVLMNMGLPYSGKVEDAGHTGRPANGMDDDLVTTEFFAPRSLVSSQS